MHSSPAPNGSRYKHRERAVHGRPPARPDPARPAGRRCLTIPSRSGRFPSDVKFLRRCGNLCPCRLQKQASCDVVLIRLEETQTAAFWQRFRHLSVVRRAQKHATTCETWWASARGRQGSCTACVGVSG